MLMHAEQAYPIETEAHNVADDTSIKNSASSGGKARAEALTPEQRREIARKAALARWGDDAVASVSDGAVAIGEQEIRCAVLSDGCRVLSQQTVLQAMGRARSAKGGQGSQSGLPPFLAARNLQEFIGDDLRNLLEAIPYRPETGGRAWGYRAEILPMVCDVYLEARKAGKLTARQEPVADMCEILVRGLAKVGIIALVDEATGYQDLRARDELQRILAYYVQAELRPWTKMFPEEFFRQVYRLQGWEYKPGTSKRTPYVGKLINHYIYEQLPPGVLERLQANNPRMASGNRSHKHHQFLTVDTGSPQLDKQISTVTTLMRISADKHEFENLFERAFPPPQERLPLRLEEL